MTLCSGARIYRTTLLVVEAFATWSFGRCSWVQWLRACAQRSSASFGFPKTPSIQLVATLGPTKVHTQCLLLSYLGSLGVWVCAAAGDVPACFKARLHVVLGDPPSSPCTLRSYGNVHINPRAPNVKTTEALNHSRIEICNL